MEIRREEELLGRGYEFERTQSAVVGQTEQTWTERVQLIRSEAAARSQAAVLERRLKHTEAAVRGLTHLLTLALRVLTLFEVLVRRGQDQSGEELPGLYPGQEKRTTDRLTAQRVPEAIARTGMTLTQVGSSDGCRWHLTALPVLVKRVLGYLGLYEDVYTRLVINSG